MGRIPEARQMEILNSNWRPKWPWKPRYVMFTSYWPDPNFFIAYGTDGHSTFALRGTWNSNLKQFLQLMGPTEVSYLRLTKYPGEDIEVISPDARAPAAFLPTSVDPTDPGSDAGNPSGAPNSASLCITVPHWNAVARAFERVLKQ